MKEKIKVLTITPDKRDLKNIQDVHDKYVPDTYLCFKARNEKEAVRVINETNPQIIVIELLKAKMDGIALLETVKQLCPQGKVFIYSFVCIKNFKLYMMNFIYVNLNEILLF